MLPDVVIVGGGIIGSAAAYYLKSLEPKLSLTVLEPDPTYARASTPLSLGVFRVQFSLRENVLMSRYGLEVLERFDEDMAVDREPPGLIFRRDGYLFLYALDQEQRGRAAFRVQQELGCQVEWLAPAELEERFPLLQTQGLAGAVYSPGDGHLDPYALLMAYRAKAASLGAGYLKAQATGFIKDRGRISGVSLASGEVIKAGTVLNAAGGWAMDLARSVGVELPIDPVMRHVFAFRPALVPPRPLPFIIAPSGLYCRSETGDLILIGYHADIDAIGFDFRWDSERFVETVWPRLAEVIPSFDTGKLVRGWAAIISQNRFDGNAFLGQWPGLEGFYLAVGFSGHGLMHAPAVGRYMAELILDRRPSLDLSAFSPQRLLDNRPLREGGVF